MVDRAIAAGDNDLAKSLINLHAQYGAAEEEEPLCEHCGELQDECICGEPDADDYSYRT